MYAFEHSNYANSHVRSMAYNDINSVRLKAEIAYNNPDLSWAPGFKL